MKRIWTLLFIVFIYQNTFAQIQTPGINVVNDLPNVYPNNIVKKRSSTNPTSCTGDTSTFPSYGSTAYNTVSVRKGAGLGQFFGAPQDLTVSGFRFFAFALSTTPARKVSINLICNLYKAGIDSLPSGSPIASDTITVDTVMGSNIPLSRITCNANFGKDIPVNYDYIITVESDSTDVSAGLVCNSWTNGDGDFRNLGVGSVSGIWYRCLNLNISGTTFNSNIQLYPFVNYKIGTDFTYTQDCYPSYDTLRFDNQNEKSVFSSIYYNRYVYSNLERICHRWNYDNRRFESRIDGRYKPSIKSNLKIQLISTIYPYTGDYCRDTSTHVVYFRPSRPRAITEAKACKGDDYTISVTYDVGSTVEWYHKTSDSKPFYEGTKWSISSAQENDTFYLKAVNELCESQWSMILFSVYDYPTTLTVQNDSICAGATANLSAKTDHGKVQWFVDSDYKLKFYEGESIQTEKLNSDTSFYVIANNEGCVYYGNNPIVKAFVGSDFAPDIPSVITDTSMCLSSTQPLLLEAKSKNNQDTLRWFTDATGGTYIHIGKAFEYSPSKRGTESLYVETWNGTCGSGRTAINIQTKTAAELFGPTGDEVCEGDTAEIFASALWGQVHWYWDRETTQKFHVGPSTKIGGYVGERFAYIRTAEDECFSKSMDSVRINFIQLPVIKSTESASVCAKSLGKMSVETDLGSVNWFDDSTSVISVHQDKSIDLGPLYGSKTMWFEVDNKGCKSKRTPLKVIVKPTPVAGFTYKIAWQYKVSCTPISTSGLDLNWDWGDGFTSQGLPALHQYEGEGDYTIQLIATDRSNLCTDTVSIPVLVSHVSSEKLDSDQIEIFPNPVSKGHEIHVKVPFDSYRWMDLSGREISGGTNHQNRISIPAEGTSGIYLLEIKSNNSRYTSKVIVTE